MVGSESRLPAAVVSTDTGTRSGAVFISYSTQDTIVADEIVRQLELVGVPCWIASRDIPLGADYASEIVPAIRNASGLLFIYSESSNQSKQCLREIETAIDSGVDIFPIRLDATPMEPGLQYRLSTIQFVDWSSSDAFRLITAAVMPRHTVDATSSAAPVDPVEVQHHQQSSEPPQVLVGRERETAVLTKILNDVLETGRGRIALIEGASGMGKSAIASHIITSAIASGFRVCTTTCGSFLDGVSFFPVREIMRQLTDSSNDLVAFAKRLYGSTSQQAAMAAIIDSTLADAGSRREATIATFSNLVLGTANQHSGQPLLIVIDDMEHADSGSIDSLMCLLARVDEGPVVVIGAYRTDGIDVSGSTPPMASLIAAVRRETRSGSILELNPLPRAAYAHVISSMLGGNVNFPGEVLDHLWKETEGNVLFLHEVVRALCAGTQGGAQPIFFMDEAGWHFEGSLDDLVTPRSVEESIERNLQTVTGPDRAHLEAAAVIGKQFRFELAAGISGTGEDDLLDSLERSMAQAIIRELPEPPDSFEFRHNKLRDVLYSSLSQIRRRRIHSKIADILIASPAHDSDSLIGEHLYYAHRLSEAASYLNRSALALMGLRESGRAAAQLLRVQDILRRGIVVDELDQVDVDLRLLRALYEANDYAKCEVLAHHLTTLPAIDEERRGWAFDVLGDLEGLRGRIPEAEAAYEQAERLSDGHPELELEVCADLHELHDRERERNAGIDDAVSKRHGAAAYEYLDREIRLAEQVGSPWDRARAYRNQAKSLRRSGDIDGALSMYEKSLAQTDPRIASHQVLISYAKTLRMAKRVDAAASVVTKVYEWSIQTGARRSKAISLYYRAMIVMDDNEASDAAKLDLDEALAIHDEIGYNRGQWEVHILRGEWFALRDEWTHALHEFYVGIGAHDDDEEASVIAATVAQLDATDELVRSQRVLNLWSRREH
jgi:tetratricopeptide (TPR) repeat protein